ncbi:16064_t:CDS:2 [Acaulospora colombiana]|uniref:16064_t:CDS:1 n=1 Tax=Acaulospora colombiana TaxID=27376 RepID=A0ACA9KPR8_9GLOM|nr:16064_t:CDS:2 [Acaulospora colombiana]
MSEQIGPQIPAHLLSKFQPKDSDEEDSDDAGPHSYPDSQLDFNEKTESAQFDPSSPQVSSNLEKGGNWDDDEDDLDAYMPELPPDILAERQRKKIEQEKSLGKSGTEKRRIGPAMPPSIEYDEYQISEEEDDVVGPVLPKDFKEKNEAYVFQSAIQEFEERSDKMRQKLESGEDGERRLERGEWMLVPPPEARFLVDLENIRRIKEYNESFRPKTLLEEHSEKYVKSKKWKQDSVSDRPFDREKDVLGARRMDSRKRQEILDNAKELSSKFGHGKSGTFL